MRLEGKVAVVTGGTRLIGRATVERFAEEGAHVVFSGRNTDDGDQLESELRDRGHTVRFVRADSGIEDDVRNLIETAVADGGRLDVLVNNAAAADLARAGGLNGLEDQPIHEVTDEAIDTIFGVGLYGVLWACRYAVRQMLKQGSGSIINLTSPQTEMGYPAVPIYSASKGALHALTRQMAVDYGRFGIRSNALLPGLIPTADGLRPARAVRTEADALAGNLTTPWVGEPRDLANAALFFASDEAKFVTGAMLAVDGGLTTFFGLAMQGWDAMRRPEFEPGSDQPTS